MTDRKYTTDNLISDYLNTSAIDDVVIPYILATQKYIESYTQRIFKADESATARLYNGNGTQVLYIDDCISVSTVEVGNDKWGDTFSTISASGSDRYYLLPTNYSEEELPINRIGLRSRYFIEGHANHRITAKWGAYENVPQDLKFAATVIASGMYYANRGENTGAIKSEKIGDYSVSYSDEGGLKDLQVAVSILDSYKKILL